MTEKTYTTPCGTIHYWTNGDAAASAVSLVFLPGLTADHRLFEKQAGYFAKKYRVLVWDAPGHASSAPFHMTFSLADKALYAEYTITTGLSGEGVGSFPKRKRRVYSSKSESPSENNSFPSKTFSQRSLTLAGITTLVSESQPRKAKSPIVVTLSGIVTLVSESQK